MAHLRPTMNVPTGYNLLAYCYFGAMAYPGSALAAPDRYGVYFSKKGFSGTATLLQSGGSPVTINTPGDGIFGQKPREATISLIAQAGFHLADFFSNNDRDLFVSIDRVTTDPIPQPVLDGNVFAGWVSPFEAKEPYATAPYPMELSAVDGLGSLADYPFYQYPSGTPYAGTITLVDALITALAWAGFHLPIYSSFHLAEESFWGTSSLGVPQHPGPHNDFFANVTVSVSRWQNDDGSWQSCKQVIDDIIGPNARLCQINGAWRILRLSELPGVSDFQGNYGYTRSWVVYDTGLSGQTVVGFVQEDPRVTVYKANAAVPLVGANLAIRRDEPRVKIEFDYGPVPDILVNGGMLGTAGTVPAPWTYIGPSDVAALGSGKIVAADDNFPSRMRILGLKNGDPARTYQTDQRYNNYEQQVVYLPLSPGQKPKITVSGTYANSLSGGAAIHVDITLGYFDNGGAFHAIPLQNNLIAGIGSTFILQADGTWGRVASGSTVQYIHFTNLQPDGADSRKNFQIPKPTKGEQFSVASAEIPNLPYPDLNVPGYIAPSSPFAKTVRITYALWPGPDYDSRTSHTGSYTDYWNLKITVGEAGLVDLAKEEIFAEVAGLTPQDRKRTTELTTHLGYQTTAHAIPAKALRPGGLLKLDGVTPIGRTMTTSGHIDKLQNIDARERLEMFGKQRVLYDGQKLTDANPLSILYFPELGGLFMLPINHKWKLRERTVEGRDVELPGTLDRITDPIITGNFLTGDGSVSPMGADAVAGPGAVVTPAAPGGSTGPVHAPVLNPIAPRFGLPGETPTPLPGTGNIIRPGFIKHG